MKFSEFTTLIQSIPHPVILLEGRRAIPLEIAEKARCLAAHLAKQFPHARFRSGNATGSDSAFAAGVMEVAPERLQIIAPYASHRKKFRHPLAHYDSPESLSDDELEALQKITVNATPANKGLIKWYQRGGKLGAQAACLIRDTMKVAGSPTRLHQPTVALFYIDPQDPMAGGTGHTIRVCRNAGVPAVFQSDWGIYIRDVA